MNILNSISIFGVILSISSLSASVLFILSPKSRVKAIKIAKYSFYTAVFSFFIGVSTHERQSTIKEKLPIQSNFNKNLIDRKIGKAKICINKNLDEAYQYIKLPSFSIFLTNVKYNISATIITLNDLLIEKTIGCSEVNIKLFYGNGYSNHSAPVSDLIIYDLINVLDYPLNQKYFKFENLVDDGILSAIVIEEPTDYVQGIPTLDKLGETERCRQGALGLSNAIGANIVRQTSSIVELSPVLEASSLNYSCGNFFKIDPDLNILWNMKSKPKPATVNLIGKAGNYLTGIREDLIKEELNFCIIEALKPQNNEMASRQFDGVQLDCHAFSRDGGGGSVTLYRRFGRHPDYISNLANIKVVAPQIINQTDKSIGLKECRQNWMKCSNNTELVENYSRYSEAQIGCKYAANKLARFGTPEWPWLPFGSYNSGLDAPKTGKIILKENEAKFSNQYGAMARVVVFCTYNLDNNSVIDVEIVPK